MSELILGKILSIAELEIKLVSKSKSKSMSIWLVGVGTKILSEYGLFVPVSG